MPLCGIVYAPSRACAEVRPVSLPPANLTTLKFTCTLNLRADFQQYQPVGSAAVDA